VAVDLDERAAAARLEVADLVEDTVVGQADLAVDRLDGAVRADREGVVDVLGALGEADEGDEVARLGGEVLERRARVAQEVLLEQQVLGRVAGDRHLREDHELRARVARVAQRRLHRVRVALEIADPGVHLGQREAQEAVHGLLLSLMVSHRRRGRATNRRSRAAAGR